MDMFQKKDAKLSLFAGLSAGLLALIPAWSLGVSLTPFLVAGIVLVFPLMTVSGLLVAQYASRYLGLLPQLVKFGTIGGLNTLLELTIINSFILGTGVALGVPFVLFKTLSYLVALVSTYAWNKYWTFESRTKFSKKEFLKFSIVNAVGLSINVGTAHVAVNVFGAPAGVSEVYWANAGVVFAVLVAMTWNFLSQKYVIFNERMPSMLLIPKWVVKVFLLRPYHKVLGSWPLWLFFNREAVELQKKSPISLTPLQKKIAEDLKRHGIAVTSIDELFPGKKYLKILQDYSFSRKEEGKIFSKKDFFIKLWDPDNEYITKKIPIVEIALSNTVLGIVNEYMGMYAELHTFQGIQTVPVGKDAPARQSQLWHRDPDDKKLCKMFVYLNDVDAETGPFCYVSGSQPKGRWSHFYGQKTKYNWKPGDGRPSDEAVDKAISKEDIRCYEGKAGTVIFADTVGIHKGGYSITKPRFTNVLSFKSRRSFTSREKYRYPEYFGDELKHMSPQALFAVGN